MESRLLSYYETSEPLQKQEGLFTLDTEGWNSQNQLCDFPQNHKKSKPFSGGEFIKECLEDSAVLIYPENKDVFENVPSPGEL